MAVDSEHEVEFPQSYQEIFLWLFYDNREENDTIEGIVYST